MTTDSGTVTEAGAAATWRVEPLASGEATTLVTLRVRNRTDAPRRVRVANRLDGPLLPPRRGGVPAAGWTDDGYEGVVAAAETLSLGYACLAPAATPPVSLTSTPARGDDEASPSAADAIRRLGPAAPPRDVVGDAVTPPAPDAAGSAGESGSSEDDTGGSEDGAGGSAAAAALATSDPIEAPDASAAGRDVAGAGEIDSVADSAVADVGADDDEVDGGGTVGDDDRATPPDDVAAWLAASARRVERAERLDGVSVADAASALDELGGIEGVETLRTRLDSDAERLRAVAREATRLADRADDATIPVDALRRLA